MTTLLSKMKETAAAAKTVPPEQLAALRERVTALGGAVKEAKAAAAADKGDAGLAAAAKGAVEGLMAAKGELAAAEEAALVVGGLRRLPNGEMDYKDDFFSRPAFLTVSGQLQARARAWERAAAAAPRRRSPALPRFCAAPCAPAATAVRSQLNTPTPSS